VTSHKDYYAVLDINPHADRRAVAEAYERLARRYQPDDSAPPTDPQRMREIDEAFDILDDPERRAHYDRLRTRQLSGGDAAAALGAGWVPAEENTEAARLEQVAATRRRPEDWIGPGLLVVGGLAFVAGAIILFVIALSGGGDRTVTLASGLRYTESDGGSGDPPNPGDALTMHYTGSLEDGTVFDSSQGGDPFRFVLGRGDVIPGWDEGIATMKEGGKRSLVIPPELGYGPEGIPGANPPIPPNAALFFDVELVEIDPIGIEVVTDSGLRYFDLDADPGPASTPKEGDQVVVHFLGTFPDGTRFVDTQGQQGQPYAFILGSGSEIKGFDEGVSTMKVGGLRRLIVPPALGYGDQVEEFELGEDLITIEPNTTLTFEVKLIGIQDPSAPGQ
jgi:peptidylprolyl isomerase